MHNILRVTSLFCNTLSYQLIFFRGSLSFSPHQSLFNDTNSGWMVTMLLSIPIHFCVHMWDTMMRVCASSIELRWIVGTYVCVCMYWWVWLSMATSGQSIPAFILPLSACLWCPPAVVQTHSSLFRRRVTMKKIAGPNRRSGVAVGTTQPNAFSPLVVRLRVFK